MESREIVRRAIEFETPPRLPFFLGGSWSDKLSVVIEGFPNDVCDCWEMDRQESGWFFDNPAEDDWGCQWKRTDVANMGQVVGHPLEDWSGLASFSPPDPRNPFYFDRIEEGIKDSGDRYVVITSHFARLLYDVQFWLRPEKRTPFSLVCDEAHLYLPARDDAVAVEKQALATFERIAKEGRKYGVSLLAPNGFSPDYVTNEMPHLRAASVDCAKRVLRKRAISTLTQNAVKPFGASSQPATIGREPHNPESM